VAGPPDHYQVLGVARTATPAQIRRAYLDRARRLHPDARAAGSDERAMQQVNAAWQVLRDPRRRWAYDLELGGGGPATFRAGPSGSESAAEPVTERPPAHSLPEDPVTDRHRTVGDLFVLVPAALLLAAVGCFAVSVMESHEGMFGFSVLLLIASAVSFLLAPFVSLARERRHR
jgi:hypothetical protein